MGMAVTLEVKRAGEQMAVVTAAAATATQGGWSVEAASWGPVAETAKQEGWSVETVNQEGRAVRAAHLSSRLVQEQRAQAVRCP